MVLAEPGVIDAWGAVTRCADEAGLTAYNVGDLCRDAVHRNTEWGERFQAHLRAGELVPDALLVRFVAEALDRSRERWMLFGFPRTVGQAESLAALGHAPGRVIRIALDEARAHRDWRLAARQGELGQLLADHRLRTAPVTAFYQDSTPVHELRRPDSIEELVAGLRALVPPATGPAAPN
ncbi:nucleoside monophosphate kinase [Micromonospora maritima]|uniref:nucleoside monophosphate kinase n=1 Tax=Micromonospora maritima TaxID=986711 RepID=UPI0037B92008